jgi:hypothetical protein
MAVYRNVGSKKTLTCTLAEAVWVADGSTIPSTESTRWGRTLQASDFPVWSFQPASVVYICKFFISTQNNSGSSQTIFYRVYKNNVSIMGNSGYTANNGYYRLFTCNIYDVKVGDVLEIALWCSPNTNVIAVGSLSHVVPTRLLPTSKPCIEVNYTFDKYTYPTPLTGDQQAYSYEYIGSNISNSISSATSRTFTGLSFVSQNSYNLFRYGEGDYSRSSSAYINSDAALQKIVHSYYPTTITFREVRRGV